MAFNEEKLELAIIDLQGEQGYPHVAGAALAREPQDVLIRAVLEAYLRNRYAAERITDKVKVLQKLLSKAHQRFWQGQPHQEQRLFQTASVTSRKIQRARQRDL